MTLLFITKYLSNDYDAIIKELQIVLVPILAVILGMMVDLYFGLKKAKELGELRTSYGLRRTVKKFIEYMLTLLLALSIDILASIIEDYSLPYVTFLLAGYLLYAEIVSIREKASEKERRKQNDDVKTLIDIIKNKGDLSKIAEKLTETKKEDKQ